jgi:hypothetical protein
VTTQTHNASSKIIPAIWLLGANCEREKWTKNDKNVRRGGK